MGGKTDKWAVFKISTVHQKIPQWKGKSYNERRSMHIQREASVCDKGPMSGSTHYCLTDRPCHKKPSKWRK